MRGTWSICTAAVILVGVLGACNQKLPEPGRPESPAISDQAKAAFMRVYTAVGPTVEEKIGVSKILSIVTSRVEPILEKGRMGEAIKDESASLVTVTEQSAGIGNWGFETFSESLAMRSAPTVTNPKGEITIETKPVYKPVKSFRTGEIKDYTSLKGTDAAGPGAKRTSFSKRFKVASEIDYVETLWNQQTSWTKRDGEVISFAYGYQSSPTMALRVSEGSRIASQATEDDSIAGRDGWSNLETKLLSADVSGFLILYRPKAGECPPNERAAAPQQRTEAEVEGKLRQTESETTVTSEQGTGPGGAEKLSRTTSTYAVITEIEKISMRPLSSSSDRHTTTAVTYSGAGDAGAASSGLVANYVETERTTETKTWEYSPDPAKMSKVTTVTIVRRYTDNPASRNNIGQWKSTKATQTKYFTTDPDDDGNIDYSGEEWLVDQIEVDPDVNGKPFSIVADVTRSETKKVSYFGSGLESRQITEAEEKKVDVKLAFGTETISYSGDVRSSDSSVRFPNDEGHSVKSGSVGTMTIAAADQKYDMHPEEFDALCSTGYAGAWAGAR